MYYNSKIRTRRACYDHYDRYLSMHRLRYVRICRAAGIPHRWEVFHCYLPARGPPRSQGLQCRKWLPGKRDLGIPLNRRKQLPVAFCYATGSFCLSRSSCTLYQAKIKSFAKIEGLSCDSPSNQVQYWKSGSN